MGPAEKTKALHLDTLDGGGGGLGREGGGEKEGGRVAGGESVERGGMRVFCSPPPRCENPFFLLEDLPAANKTNKSLHGSKPGPSMKVAWP